MKENHNYIEKKYIELFSLIEEIEKKYFSEYYSKKNETTNYFAEDLIYLSNKKVYLEEIDNKIKELLKKTKSSSFFNFYNTFKKNIKETNIKKDDFSLLEDFKKNILERLFTIYKNLKKDTTNNKYRHNNLYKFLSVHDPTFSDQFQNSNPERFKDTLKILQEIVPNSGIENYLEATTLESEVYFFNTLSAIFLIIHNHFIPEKNNDNDLVRKKSSVDLKILARIKGFQSFQRNSDKELLKGLNSMFPEYPYKGHDPSDFSKFPIENLLKDIGAATIILENIDEAFDYSQCDDSELKSLFKNSQYYLKAINYFREKIPKVADLISYYNLKKEILSVLVGASYPEFTDEYDNKSYQNELKETNNIIMKLNANAKPNKNLNNIGKPNSNRTQEQIDNNEENSKEIEDLYSLINQLVARKDDKLQFHFLKTQIIPLLSNDDLLKMLNVKIRYIKTVVKENGFRAYYCMIETPRGNFELQLQTDLGYRVASTNHDTLDGKSFPEKKLFSVFEPVNPMSEEKFQEILNILNSTYYEVGDKRIEGLRNTVKLKDYVSMHSNGKLIKIPIEEYLLHQAFYYCPNKSVSVSIDDRTTGSRSNTTFYDIVNRFSDFLRHNGKQSELVDLLIHRLRTYITLNEKEKQQFDEYKTFKNRLNGPELNPIKKGIWEEELQNNPFFKTPQRVLALEEIENQQLMKTMLQTTYLNLLAYATEYARQQENEITK